MTVEIQTLKQAAQALRNTRNPHVLDLVAALEAMAEMQPVAWMATRLHSVVIAAKREDLFAFGQQQHISPLYAAPIATPEHDAKVRDAALEEAARCADAHSGRPVAGEVMAHAIRYLKSTGADHE